MEAPLVHQWHRKSTLVPQFLDPPLLVTLQIFWYTIFSGLSSVKTSWKMLKLN